MSFALCFWILMLLWLVLAVGPSFKYSGMCGSATLFILLLLLGWKVFGQPLHQ